MESQTALITGASAGIGKVFAEKLAARGYNLILTSRRKHLLDLHAEAYTHSHRVSVETIAADLSIESGIDTVIEQIQSCDDLTLLVNNAGFGTPGRFHEYDINRQKEMLNVHLWAAVKLTHACLPGMIERRKGNIINVSSVASFTPSPTGGTYCASKAYLTMLSESLTMEYHDYGIVVQSLCPGFTHTEFHDAAGYTDEDLAKIPKWAWLSAEKVVNESLAGLRKNKSIVIPGKIYKLMVWLFRAPIFGWLMRKHVLSHRHD
ncbi:MAG: SDR family oxidoreductase [candidate division Zixibacteria bacterium]